MKYVLKRLSKSKLAKYDACPKKYWYSVVTKTKPNYTSDYIQMGKTGNNIHSIDEHFLKNLYNDKSLANAIITHGVRVIKQYFDGQPFCNGLTDNLSRWHQYRWFSLCKRFKPEKAMHYFRPIKTDKLLFVEQKIYSPFIDSVAIIDSLFWIPEQDGKDSILVHDLKSTKNKQYKATWRRKELWFTKHILDSIPKLFPDHEIKYGAITYVGEDDIRNMPLFIKFTKQQENSVLKLVTKLKYSVENDAWDYKPTDWCIYCEYVDVCNQGVVSVEEFINS